MLVELGLEALEQSECIGGCAGKSSKNAIVVDTPYLACTFFYDDRSERNLTIATHRNRRASSHRDYRRTVKRFHAAGTVRARVRTLAAAHANVGNRRDAQQMPQGRDKAIDVAKFDRNACLLQLD